jgi:hypothetical protein
MVTVECPWCTSPATVADDDTVLDCDDCSVRVDLAPDTPSVPVALAA